MKKWLLSLILLVTLLPSVAFAHTGLEKSTPAAGETVTSPVGDITLEFEGKLEPLSTFDVLNQAGETIKPANVTVDGSTLKGSFATPLADGDYQVHYKIVGQDGHTIEKSFGFTVKSAGAAASPSPTAAATLAPTAANTTAPAVTTTPIPTPEPATEPVVKGNSNRVTTIVTLIVVVVILILITLWLRRKRK